MKERHTAWEAATDALLDAGYARGAIYPGSATRMRELAAATRKRCLWSLTMGLEHMATYLDAPAEAHDDDLYREATALFLAARTPSRTRDGASR